MQCLLIFACSFSSTVLASKSSSPLSKFSLNWPQPLYKYKPLQDNYKGYYFVVLVFCNIQLILKFI